MKEIELNVEGRKVKATIRKITYGEYNAIMQACTETNMTGSVMRSSVNAFKFQRLLVEKAVTLSQGKVDDLPMDEGIRLEEVVMEINDISATSSFQNKSS